MNLVPVPPNCARAPALCFIYEQAKATTSQLSSSDESRASYSRGGGKGGRGNFGNRGRGRGGAGGFANGAPPGNQYVQLCNCCNAQGHRAK